MADVKWIKITTDMFDNRKIRHLRRLPDGNNIVLIWVMLLTMAGRCNSSGMIFLTENIPYTPKMLADELDFEENTVQLALNALEQLNMVVMNGGFFSIAGWDEYQNIEGMERIREQNRKRVAKHRENKKKNLIGAPGKCVYCGENGDTIDHIIPRSKGGLDIPQNTVCCCLHCNMQKNDHDVAKFLNDRLLLKEPVDIDGIIDNSVLQQYIRFDYTIQKFVTLHVMQCNGADKEEDKERDKEGDIKEIHKEMPDYQQIVDMFNSICVSLPSVRSLSDARKKAIKARLTTYTIDDFRQCFENAEASSFLKGGNDRNWVATFDWLIKDTNMAKVLDGNFANREGKGRPGNSSFDTKEFFEAAVARSWDEKETPRTASEDDSIRERMETLKGRLG